MTEKKYLRDNKKLMAEWNYEKNIGVDPLELTMGMHKMVWWRCENGHEWSAIIYSRANGNNCPYCSNQKVLKGVNDLATTHPELVKEWLRPKDDDKLTPFNSAAGSNKYVIWKCSNPKCGHEWAANIYSRTSGTGCPKCARKGGNRIVERGVNDLATTHPELVKEWLHPTYDESLTPYNLSAGSNEYVTWKCSNPKCGHEWAATIYNRTSGTGCPKCCSTRKMSIPEMAIYFYLKKIDEEIISQKEIDNSKIDIFIPSLKIGIEYDGVFYHNSEKSVIRDKKKDKKCRESGIRIIRVKEYRDGRLPNFENDVLTFTIDSGYKQIDEVICLLIKEIYGNISPDVNFKRDRIKIEKLYRGILSKNSVAKKHPELVKYWHPELNNGLTLEQFSCGSHTPVNWVCDKGHTHLMPIKDKVNGRGCPICANKIVLEGFNDLRTLFPEIAKQWHPTKNGDLTPETVYASSMKKVWWYCENCGYVWSARIHGRVRKSGGCPKCHHGKQKKNDER